MATLRELAEDTGFSITTISRVLNDDPTMNVTDATRAAILEAAGRLHYRAAARPRRGRGGRPKLRFALAEMLSPAEQLTDPYYLYLRTYAEQHCRDLGCALERIDAAPDAPAPAERIDGILAVGIFSAEQIERLAALSGNTVFLDSSPDELRFDSVVLDFRLGIEQALDYLTGLGHRRIGFLGPDRRLDQRKRPAPEVRRQYYCAYMQRAGLYDPGLLLETAMDAAAARAAVRALCGGAAVPTALLAANEEVAIGAVRALRESGRRVPRDVSVISFNDTPRSALTDPPLTSISTHVEVMAQTAVELLTRRAAAAAGSLPLKIVVPPTLIRRESVCPPLDPAAACGGK